MLTEEMFKDKTPVPEKLLAYGFTQKNGAYIFTGEILGGEFSVLVTVSNGAVQTRTFERETGEEYSLHLVESAQGSFVSKVREAYCELLQKICAACFEGGFHEQLSKAVAEYVRRTYGCELEFLWEDLPTAAIWRRADNKKWFGAIMRISAKKLVPDASEKAEADILDVRILPDELDALADGKKYFRGYHMNKKHWLTVKLDGSVPLEEVCRRIDTSYLLAAKK